MSAPWLRQITALSVLMLGVACDASTARSTITTLHRDAFLGHAVTCNAAPFVDTMPPRTELGSMLDCLGWQEWVDERDLQLDVVRYGTIVKLTKLYAIQGFEGTMRDPYFTKAIAVNVDHVLKGSAAVGTFEITVPIAIGSDPAHRMRRGLVKPVDENDAHLRGGYANLIFDDEPGLLFIPSDRVDDPIFLGCIGGHFAKPDAFRPKLLTDYELLTQLLASRSVASLATEPLESPLVQQLSERGGSTSGYFVAEFFGWRAAIALLSRSMDQTMDVSPFELGLVEGAIRMQALRRIREYGAPAWQDVDDTALAAKLVDWAILRFPYIPPKDNRLKRDTMTDRQRHVAAWILSQIHAMAPDLRRGHLSSTDTAIDSARDAIPDLRAPATVVDGYTASLDDFERLLEGRPPENEAQPPSWFTSVGVCATSGGESVSRIPLHDWAREAFGERAVRRWHRPRWPE